MRILLTNDDGIHAPGILAAAKALREVADVVVCAPDQERSGTGTSVSLQHPVQVNRIAPIAQGVPSYTVDGTPCDAVLVALDALFPGQVDLVVAGINAGSNLGEDVLVSGTVGAALQGYFRGVPAIAVSVAAVTRVLYGPAGGVLKLLVRQLEHAGLENAGHTTDRPLLLNVNVPNVPLNQLGSVRITRPGRRAWADVVSEAGKGRQMRFRVTRSNPVGTLVEGTDIWAIHHNHVSITPLQIDLTHSTVPRLLGPIARKVDKALKATPRSPSTPATA